jgi:hypothetical protein
VAKTEIKIRLIKFAFIVVHPNHYPHSLPKTREILPTSPIRPLALSASTHVPSHFQSPINGPCSVADTDHTQPSAILLSLYLRNKDKSTIAQRLHHRPNLHHYIPFLRRTIHTPTAPVLPHLHLSLILSTNFSQHAQMRQVRLLTCVLRTSAEPYWHARRSFRMVGGSRYRRSASGFEHACVSGYVMMWDVRGWDVLRCVGVH